jgi:hypothetical protein
MVIRVHGKTKQLPQQPSLSAYRGSTHLLLLTNPNDDYNALSKKQLEQLHDIASTYSM